MKKYIGTKTVLAKLVTVKEAEKALGKKIDMSKHEKDTEGYLVEYADGYQSFSPKEVFEEAYKPAETFIDRLHVELSELKEKASKLAAFIDSDKFNTLVIDEQEMLKEQLSHMNAYAAILEHRIGLHKEDK